MSLRDLIQVEIDNWEKLGHPSILERFVLRNGKPFTPGQWIGKLNPIKECFSNSAQSINVGPYVEGFVIREGIPIKVHHAWNAGPNDTALDSTLRPPLNPKFTGLEYFGVQFTTDEVFDNAAQTGYWGILTDGRNGMLNTNLMFKRDPELKNIIEEITGRKF